MPYGSREDAPYEAAYQRILCTLLASQGVEYRAEDATPRQLRRTAALTLFQVRLPCLGAASFSNAQTMMPKVSPESATCAEDAGVVYYTHV